MITKKLMAMALTMSLVALSCNDDKKEQEVLDKQLEQIEAAEVAIDSTVNDVKQKAAEVKDLLKELDSI